MRPKMRKAYGPRPVLRHPSSSLAQRTHPGVPDSGACLARHLTTPATYAATTRLFFSVRVQSISDLDWSSAFFQRQMASYAQVATSPMVLEPVIRRLDLPLTARELAKSVEATAPVGTVIVEIAVTDRNPRRAAEIANAVGAELSTVAGGLTPGTFGTVKHQADGQLVRMPLQATTIEAAQVPDKPSRNILVRFGVGLVLGLMVGICVALLRSMMDNKVDSNKDVRR